MLLVFVHKHIFSAQHSIWNVVLMQSRRNSSFSSYHKLGFYGANSVSNHANVISHGIFTNLCDFSWYSYKPVFQWPSFIGVQMQAEPKRSGPSTSVNSRKTSTTCFCPWCRRILTWSKKQEGAHLISEGISPFPLLWPCRGRWLEPEHGRLEDFLDDASMERMLWCQILLIMGSYYEEILWRKKSNESCFKISFPKSCLKKHTSQPTDLPPLIRRLSPYLPI